MKTKLYDAGAARIAEYAAVAGERLYFAVGDKVELGDKPMKTKSSEQGVILYVVTGIKHGKRTLIGAPLSCNTYATAAEAQAWIDVARVNNSASTLAIFGGADALEVRPVECWTMAQCLRSLIPVARW